MRRGSTVRPAHGRKRATSTSSIVSAVVAAGTAAAVARLLRAAPTRSRERWQRVNHAGRPVTLLEGPTWVLGATAGALVPGGAGVAAAFVTGSAGVLGAVDDLAGTTARKGFKGHLGALARGEVTTGALKIVGLGVTGLGGALAVDRGRHGLLTSLVGGAVVAGAANAVNLFDLRPGRALKVVLASGVPLALSGSPSAAAALGASLATLPDDLSGRSMLGDTGANAAGALLGTAVLQRAGLGGRLAALGVLTALTVASERVSFTKVIESHDLLRRLDQWGRPGT